MRLTTRPAVAGRRAGRLGPVLVVSHEASRTGAPRVAVDVLRALAQTGAHCIVVHRWGGPLTAELNAAADGSVSEPLWRLRVALRRWRRTRNLAVGVERLGASIVLARLRPSLVWCNTVLSASYVAPAQRRGIPVVLHSHELMPLVGTVLDRYRLADAATGALAGVWLAACSDHAASTLSEVLGVDSEAITVLPSPIDVTGVRCRAAKPSSEASRPEGRFRVVACATGDRRKGLDLFSQLAASLERTEPGRYDCVWVGRIEEASLLAGTADIRCIGEVPDAAPLLADADVFVLPSRVDAFPLVVLEAMALERPVVAFAVGGVPQQLGDTGVLVEPEDVDGMAAAVQALANDTRRRKQLGAGALERVKERWDLPAFGERVERLANAAIGSLDETRSNYSGH